MRTTTILVGAAASALFGLVAAHGDHAARAEPAPKVDENADWMTKHMAGKSTLSQPRLSWSSSSK
jgi:cytochrome c5